MSLALGPSGTKPVNEEGDVGLIEELREPHELHGQGSQGSCQADDFEILACLSWNYDLAPRIIRRSCCEL